MWHSIPKYTILICNNCFTLPWELKISTASARLSWMLPAGPWFSIKMSSYQYRKSHCGDKTILRPSYLHNGISYTGKTASLYWIGAQFTNTYMTYCHGLDRVVSSSYFHSILHIPPHMLCSLPSIPALFSPIHPNILVPQKYNSYGQHLKSTIKITVMTDLQPDS